MKKDRSNFTNEELIAEIEYFEKDKAELERRIKTARDEGRKEGLNTLKSKIYPLYTTCFTDKGWIGYANLNTANVGKKLLELLATFHGEF